MANIAFGAHDDRPRKSHLGAGLYSAAGVVLVGVLLFVGMNWVAVHAMQGVVGLLAGA